MGLTMATHTVDRLGSMPGPGDYPPPDCGTANIAQIRASIENSLRHALVRDQFVSWGPGTRDHVADAIQGWGFGVPEVDAAFRRLASAQAIGAPADEILAAWGHYWSLCLRRFSDDLLDRAIDGRPVTFPEHAQ